MFLDLWFKRMGTGVRFLFVLAFFVALTAKADPDSRSFRDGRRYVGPHGQHEAQQYRRQRVERFDPDRIDGYGRERLTREERRQLRRDIQDAGREIYPPRRPRSFR